jgi:hypothetical protein
MGWPAFEQPAPLPYGSRISKEQALAALKEQALFFEDALEDLKQRISEIESSTEEAETK